MGALQRGLTSKIIFLAHRGCYVKRGRISRSLLAFPSTSRFRINILSNDTYIFPSITVYYNLFTNFFSRSFSSFIYPLPFMNILSFCQHATQTSAFFVQPKKEKWFRVYANKCETYPPKCNWPASSDSTRRDKTVARLCTIRLSIQPACSEKKWEKKKKYVEDGREVDRWDDSVIKRRIIGPHFACSSMRKSEGKIRLCWPAVSSSANDGESRSRADLGESQQWLIPVARFSGYLGSGCGLWECREKGCNWLWLCYAELGAARGKLSLLREVSLLRHF